MAPQPDPYFPTFSRFIDAIGSAQLEHYASRPDAKVANEQNFVAMKQHILNLYDGVQVVHSFVDENDQIFDCIPVRQQPSLKGTSTVPAEAPERPPRPAGRAGVALQVQPQLRPDRKDKYGHSMSCPPGTIPMRRVTLDELTKHESLQHFFRKVPVGVGRHPRLSPPDIASGVHKYAHAYQVVLNGGGASYINIWDPAVGSQVFSLAQHWYAGGSPVQTAECGSQVYPAKYGTTQPVLFTYWTADGYQNTGCYNLDCSAFVQIDSTWMLGGTLAPVSVSGGTQYEIQIGYMLYQGNWWLQVQNTWVGYYPGSLYEGGQLASNASDIDFGGEVVDATAWPPMGSGDFASAGWQQAAYMRDIIYYVPAGEGISYVEQASLTGSQTSSNCFTIDVEVAADPWNEYFFFGGPGGTECT